jgi:hypothetical protein
VHKYFKTHKLKYIFRVLINNLKFIKREGLLSGYYILQGFFKYLKTKDDIGVTPVSISTQQFFADAFWSTKPIFLPQKNKVINKLK